MVNYLVIPPVLQPDLVHTPSAEEIEVSQSLSLETGRATRSSRYVIPRTSRGVRLQLTALQIVDGLRGLLGREEPGGVYVVTTIIDGNPAAPVCFQGKSYEGVRNGEMLPLGPAHSPGEAFTVYHRERPLPRVLSFSLLVLKSNERLRTMAPLLAEVSRAEPVTRLSHLVGEAARAANPVFGIIWQAANEATSLLGSYLGAKSDDQLAYYQANYTYLFDDLGRGKHPPDAPTFPVGRVRLGYQVDIV
jgi:hypothetical protein